MVTLKNFSHRLKSKNHLVQCDKRYYRQVLLNGFHLIGHVLGKVNSMVQYSNQCLNERCCVATQITPAKETT